jgi:DNA-binding GntR family transcriptional regulator
VRPAAEQAAQALRDEILSGAIASGARLGEAELAGRLRVSRTPIREALTRLAAEGLVELQPNRGARVATWSTAELREIFELRLRLEPYAVRQAVPKLAPEQLDEL